MDDDVIEEKNRPLPAMRAQNGLSSRLGKLKPGEGCLSLPKARKRTVYALVQRFQNHPLLPGMRFTTQVDGDRIRVWRVK